MRPWAWMLAMLVAGFAILEAFIYMVSYPGTGIGLAMMLMPGLIALYLMSSDVKAAFGLAEPKA